MAVRLIHPAGLFLPGLLAGAAAIAQPAHAPVPPASQLRTNPAMLLLDYPVVRVVGDKPIDLMGFHVLNQVADGLYLGAGFFAPLFKGYAAASRPSTSASTRGTA